MEGEETKKKEGNNSGKGSKYVHLRKMWNKESRYHQFDVMEEIILNVGDNSELKSMNFCDTTNLYIIQLFSKAYLRL